MKSLRFVFPLIVCTCGLLFLPQEAAAQTATVPVVKMFSPGAKPRKKLRYRFSPGSSFRMTITMHMNIQMKILIPGQAPIPQNIQIPPLSLVNVIRCVQRQPNGDARIDSRLVEANPIEVPGQNPAMVASIKQELQKLRGMAIQYLISDDGNIKTAQIVHQPQMAPQFQQLVTNIQNSFRQMVTPLPQEAVGLGASWAVINQLTQPFEVKQSTRFQLLKHQGSLLELSVEALQSAQSQKRTVQSMGKSVPVSMSIRSKGQGKTVLRLNSLFINASLHMLSNMVVDTLADQQKQTVHTTMDIKTYIRSRKAVQP